MTNSIFNNFTLAGSYASAIQVANDNDKQRKTNHPETKNRGNESKYRLSLAMWIAKLQIGHSWHGFGFVKDINR